MAEVDDEAVEHEHERENEREEDGDLPPLGRSPMWNPLEHTTPVLPLYAASDPFDIKYSANEYRLLNIRLRESYPRADRGS